MDIYHGAMLGDLGKPTTVGVAIGAVEDITKTLVEEAKSLLTYNTDKGKTDIRAFNKDLEEAAADLAKSLIIERFL